MNLWERQANEAGVLDSAPNVRQPNHAREALTAPRGGSPLTDATLGRGDDAAAPGLTAATSEGPLPGGSGSDSPGADICLVYGCGKPQAMLGPCQEHLDESIAEEERRDVEAVERIAELEAALQRSRDDHQGAVEQLAKVRALVEAEDARVEEANKSFAERGLIEPKSGKHMRIAGIVPTYQLRAALGDQS